MIEENHNTNNVPEIIVGRFMAQVNQEVIFFRLIDEKRLFLKTLIFRKQFFIDTHKWDMTPKNGLEVDEFDDEDTYYCAIVVAGEVQAMFRARRCNVPYLTKVHFEHLLTDVPRLSVDPNKWEISRFGVMKNAKFSGLALYAAMFEFAHRHNAISLIALASPQHERLLHRIGIETVRYGPQVVVGHDRDGQPIHSCIGEIPLAAQSSEIIHSVRAHLQNLEIFDATSFERPVRVSA